jgi:hypothetical protein
LTAGTIASDAQVTGTYGTFALGAGEKFYFNAATAEHTGTDGVLDLDLVPTTAATGVVAADIHITAPALGIEATTHYGLNVQYTGDAQDEGAAIVQLIQVGYTPNTSPATVYGMYSNDNDLDYFIFNDGTAQSRYDGEVIFANNPATATFGLSTTDTDVVLTFDALGATQGTITWMEDEDRFDFDNDVDIVADLTAGTIASDAGLSGVNLTTTGRRVITPGDQELSAAETLAITSSEMTLYSDGGAVVSTADPALTNGTADGEVICVMGTSDANTIQWLDETGNPGSTLELSGGVAFTMGLGDRLCLRWYASGSKWYEITRSDN